MLVCVMSENSKRLGMGAENAAYRQCIVINVLADFAEASVMRRNCGLKKSSVS